MPWHFPSRPNKSKHPSSPWEGGAGMKIRKCNLKPLPPQWIFHPIIFTPHVTSSTKEHRVAAHLSLPTLPPERVPLLNKSSLCFPGLRISSLTSFWDEIRTYPLVTPLSPIRIIAMTSGSLLAPSTAHLSVCPPQSKLKYPVDSCQIMSTYAQILSCLSILLKGRAKFFTVATKALPSLVPMSFLTSSPTALLSSSLLQVPSLAAPGLGQACSFLCLEWNLPCTHIWLLSHSPCFIFLCST